MSYEYADKLDGGAKLRYSSKLATAGLTDSQCPYKRPADVWTDNSTKWPAVHYADIYHYLINTPGS